MNLTDFNTTVNALNQRLLWTGQRQVLPAKTESHITLDKLHDLQGRFKALVPRSSLAIKPFLHPIPALKPYYANRYDNTQNYIGYVSIGQIPDKFDVWQQFWDQDRHFTPMQHVAPRVWLDQPNHGILDDWQGTLAAIREGVARLNFLPYTAWRVDTYERSETGTGFFTFGEGQTYGESRSTQNGRIYDYTDYTINIGESAWMDCDPANAATSSNLLSGTFHTLTMKNPYLYPIQITLFVTIMPGGGGGHYFVPGCGDCTIDYTIPELTIDTINGNEFISPNCFVAEYENSIRNATWRTETFTLAPNTEQTYGPTGLNDFGAPAFCRRMWDLAQSRGIQTYCQCAGGRAFEILAYYRPVTG
ncbi:MAG: hypothetical protein IJK97_06245, partial [Thermoguttaceae bacterium]|nr:hypothetical protein [Thermoguttaceae bacterium]